MILLYSIFIRTHEIKGRSYVIVSNPEFIKGML